MLELIGVGCNFCGQLYIPKEEQHKSKGNPVSSSYEAPAPVVPYSTIEKPTVIMEAKSILRVLYVDWATLVVERDGEIIIRGYAPRFRWYKQQDDLELKDIEQCELPIKLPHSYRASDVKKGFGNRYSLTGLLMSDGSILAFSETEWKFRRVENKRFKKVVDIAYSLSGTLCVLGSDGFRIDMYESVESMYNSDPYTSSLRSLTHDDSPPTDTYYFDNLESNPNECQFTSIHACASTFVALTDNGRIFTAGDPRHDSLGRETHNDDDENEHPWGVVSALDGVTIKKVCTNNSSWIQAAISDSDDLYLWGGYGNVIVGLPTRDDDDVVGLIDLNDEGENFRDVEDVVVGSGHVAFVERGGRNLWVAGKADCAELGFGVEWRKPVGEQSKGEAKRTSHWRSWSKNMLGEGRITQVSSGVFNTLVLMDRNDIPEPTPKVEAPQSPVK